MGGQIGIFSVELGEILFCIGNGAEFRPQDRGVFESPVF